MKLFLRYIKPYRISVIILLIFLGGQSACEIMIPTLLATMINDGVSSGNQYLIMTIGLQMVLAAVVAILCAIAASYLAARTSTKLSAGLREQVFFKVEDFSLHEVDQIGTSSLITRTTNDIMQIQTFMTFLMRIGVFAPLMTISGIVMAVITGRNLALTLLVVVPVMSIAIVLIIAKSSKYFKSMQKKIDAINRVLRENLIGIKVIRAFKRSGYEIKRFDAVNEDYTQTSITALQLMSTLVPTVTIIMNLTTIAIIYLGGKMVYGGTMNVGNLVAYVQYITQILMSIMMISMIFIMYPRAATSSERIAEVLDMKLAVTNPGKLVKESRVTGTVEFRNVSFNYPNADDPVLKNISFQANPNETVAIIGSTGSGKSTIANLILRFYDVTEGEILVDGINIKEFDLHTLRNKIGYVPQKGVLFTGTIAENLRFGRQDASIEEVRHAAEVAQAMEFVQDKENQFDSMISQGGANVSGGQKQRLAIARALIKKPEIYVFDDSFSALDYKTDVTLRKALKKETVDATVIIVAQRVSTIMDANKIIVLDNGMISDIGTHKELLNRCRVYQEIVESQFKKGELGA
ncbi:ABC transporter ATP-binding protein [Pelosinus sp. UFO1]|uniref:ABC transporter ATP-binding protein n=1 Tax=Pelosinus sp. UFO1 TaxID=484770 RepID=UPI0004D14A4B|nr:ABC transporter ATP-binding protein [Pelosinus sp. UFO1]AIF52977.1 Xenobiotic-transporting ATPase [Pelosinus sp. UFO1]